MWYTFSTLGINLKFTVLCSGANTLSSFSLGFLGAMEPEITTLGSSIPVPCVQELAKETRSTVPPRYVRFPNEPPIISDTTSLPQVPVIDMQRLFSAEFKDTELEKLHYASKEWGFFQVNLSLPLSMKRMFRSGKTVPVLLNLINYDQNNRWLSGKKRN